MILLVKIFTNITDRNVAMKQQEIIKKIGAILTELQDQYEFIQKTNGPINDLELEVFIANSHFLNDHIEILRKINGQYTATETESASPISQKFFEPVVQPVTTVPANKPEAIAEDADFEPTDEKQTEEPLIRHELRLEDIEDLSDEDEDQGDFDDMDVAYDRLIAKNEEETTAASTKAESAIAPVVPQSPIIREPPVIADAIEERLLTINQRVSAQMAQTSRLGDQLPPIKDLKSAINLNDKMLYVKDLFNGYSMSYSEAVDLLNRCNTFEEADQFLQNGYAVKNNWTDKQGTVDKFYALLRRRFPQ